MELNDFIKVADNKIVNTRFIRWIQKVEDCYYICSKMEGCHIMETSRVCKSDNIKIYNALNEKLQQNTNQ